ncbi:hypothetical protein O0L34_g9072 [Tuta absoluta]|nr:hypothetical protein O0L34_g9072 [Tuta absoluta]
MWSRPGTKSFLVVGLAVLAASGVVRTHRRNADWRDRATILRADLVTLPQNAKLHYNFANFLRETEQQDNAIKHYKEALSLWPTYASAHNNVGTLVSGAENAEHHFLQAIKFNKYHVNAHYNLGKLYKKNGRTSEAMTMLEKCVWLQPRFVHALVELLTLTAESEKQHLLKRLIQLEPNNWEHHVLYGDWFKAKGFPKLASQFYLEATRLSFRSRNIAKPVRVDLIAFRSTALMYRALGQRSRTLQILARWHTWRRGWPSAAATHLYLRDWRLKMELEGRVQIYSKAVNPAKTTTCFDHSQLAVENKIEDKTSTLEEPTYKTRHEVPINMNKEIVSATSDKSKTSECDCKKSGTKKRDLSILTQIKTTHNKSEIGLKEKKCTLKRKEKTVKNTNVIPNLGGPLEHILMKTF